MLNAATCGRTAYGAPEHYQTTTSHEADSFSYLLSVLKPPHLLAGDIFITTTLAYVC